jgi:hypothetical protein
VSVVAGGAESSQDGVQAGGVGRDDAGLVAVAGSSFMGAWAWYQAGKYSGWGEGEGAQAGGV